LIRECNNVAFNVPRPKIDPGSLMKMTVRVVIQLLFILFTVGVSQSGFAADTVPVFVSIVPQKYFVQKIGKGLVDVQVMVQPGASPHTYEPKPGQMTALSKTRIYFAIGVSFEQVWLDKIAATNPHMKVVRTDQGIEKIPMAAHHHDDGDGEHEGNTEPVGHGILDPHIWLSPPLVKIQARSILNALQAIDPDHRSVYEANFNAFIAEITALDLDLQHIFNGQVGLRFMVFHPAWGYFAQAYGIQQVPIEVEGKDPKPSQLKEVIEHARENGIGVIFVQPQFSAKSAKVVAREIGGHVVYADPLAGDWLENLREVGRKFKAALR